MSKRGKIVLDKSQYVGLAVDIDGEINLIRKDGVIEVLFPRRSVLGMSTISDGVGREPISWVFFFHEGPVDDQEKARRLHLDYLEIDD